jgi:hypothetical protein
LVFAAAAAASGASVAINDYTFDLDQFDGATVTYREDGYVDFDGKKWDQAAGVNGYTLGELAAGQYGSDPGDQVSLNDTSTPDWLQLNYATPIELTSSLHTLVIYEISSYQYVDPEGLSFNIRVNGGSLVSASAAEALNFNAGMGSDGQAEDCNQLVFDLFGLGFGVGDSVSTVYIENIDAGSGISDPDFIFAGMATAVPLPAAAWAGMALLGAMGGVAGIKRRLCRA